MNLGTFGKNVTTTGELIITKPVGSICVSFEGTIAELKDEKISVMVERDNGNAIVLNRVSLLSLLLMQTYSQNIVEFNGFKTNAILPLTPDGGAVALGQNERIKVVVEDLQKEKVYQFHAEEEPFTTNKIYDYDKKACLVGEEQRLLDFHGYDQIVIQGSDSLKDLRIIYDNGVSCLHTLFEVKVNSYVCDPLAFIADGSITTEIKGALVMPLLGVKQIDFGKSKNDLVEFLCRKVKVLTFSNTGINPRPRTNTYTR